MFNLFKKKRTTCLYLFWYYEEWQWGKDVESYINKYMKVRIERILTY